MILPKLDFKNDIQTIKDMETGLILFLCLAPVVLGVAFIFVCFLNYKENPIWRMQQVSRLEVGEIRWLMGSPKKGVNHRIAVVKEIDKKKHKIIFDEYILQNGKYKKIATDVKYSYYDFFNFSYGEPVYEKDVLQ